ncbi:serine/threonine-protein kinase [Thiorhodococcus minor]|uniref:non-specific serine/threonine protein kinase n=1 Tax=Thiorhodococcus minor TaxID=57489 RepID=A0A6M0K0S0_9GAMM|nr:serine/threonine-protein kinase [Thiorhodococcus minor]NEV63352.1 protein kinase [Thiorhodococcus minor]
MDNPDLQLPQISRYRVEAVLGRGGMATVFLAVQESLARQVALKVMTEDLSRQPEFRSRFLKEGRLIAQLAHPNIVTIYDIGVSEELHYFSMTYLPGGTLKERIRAGAPLADALDILRSLASALAYAHHQGIVHRDIKPSNVLFNAAGAAVLADFGIAKNVGEETQLTSTGLTLGSVPYMSPEQFQGDPVDHRADLYGLGVLFWQMLTGSLPFQARDPFAVAVMHTKAPIPQLPSELRHFQPLIARLLAKRPDDRFSSADEVIGAIEAIPERLRKIAAPASAVTNTVPMLNPTRSGRSHGAEVAQASARPAPGRSRLWVAAASVVALAFGLGGYFGLGYLGSSGTAPKEGAASAVQSSVSLGADPKDLLQRAEQRMREGKILAPPGDNAFELFRQLLSLDPENVQAKQRLVDIGRIRAADRILSVAEDKLRQGAIEDAQQLIRTGLKLNPEDERLIGLARALE